MRVVTDTGRKEGHLPTVSLPEGGIRAARVLEEGVHSWRHPPLPDPSLSMQQNPAGSLPATALRAAAGTPPPPSDNTHPQQEWLEAFPKRDWIPLQRGPELTATFPTGDSSQQAPAFQAALSPVTAKLLSGGPSTPRAGT